MEYKAGLGATGSGKSYLDYAYVIPQRIMKHKGEGLITMFGYTRDTFERNVLQPMRDIWGEDFVPHLRAGNTIRLFGKTCYVLGACNSRSVSAIQGQTIEYAYGDEITTWSQSLFEMLKSRLRCEHSVFDGTCNPDNPQHWFKAFLDSGADIYQQKYTIDDNPFLPAEFVANLKREYEGTVYYQRYILGNWTQAEGMIYPRYHEALQPFPEGAAVEDIAVSIDYGTQNAFAAMLWQKSKSVWYAVRCYYYSGRAEQLQKTDYEYGEDLDNWLAPVLDEREERRRLTGMAQPKIKTIIDPSAASFIALLRKKPWCKVMPAQNDVANGIRNTATAMHTGIIKIDPTLKPWVSEAEGYVWEDGVEDKPKKVNDHCLTGDTTVETTDGSVAIKDLVGQTGKVYTIKDGERTERRFERVRLTQKRAQIYRIDLADGRFIRCTGEHLILTAKGWKRADKLTENDEIIDVS